MSGATHLYAIAIGSNRPHGRFGRPRRWSKRRSRGSTSEFGLFDASPIILNPAHGGAGRDFANAVALVESELEPPECSESPQGASSASSAAARGRRWGPRVLDLDLVAWSGGKWRSRGLDRPAPSRSSERSFVIGPLGDDRARLADSRRTDRTPFRPSPCPPPPTRVTAHRWSGP